MSEFVECQDCEFVLLHGGGEDPLPKGRDDCPACGGSVFEFTGK